MYFGVNYYPEQWVFPYGGTAEEPEAAWKQDAERMAEIGVNIVRMGEFTWGLCEKEDGKFDFRWLERAMEVMGNFGIKVVLCTPTAAPPAWLSRKYPEMLPVNEYGLRRYEGTRHAVCLNNDTYWSHAQRVVEQMAKALGNHPGLVAWQADNSIGGDATESSFNEDSRLEWQNWLKLKYETIEKLNSMLGLRQWGQVVSDWSQIPMPMNAPTPHNPALALDWRRFCSDTVVAFVRMQVDLLHKITPNVPVTTNLRALRNKFDHFDLANVLDFVSIEATSALKQKSAELACEIDMMRSLKRKNIRTPNGDSGFWVMEQSAGHVSWNDVHSLTRPGVLRMLSYQLVSRGANALLYHRWREPRFGAERLHGALMHRDFKKQGRTFKEVVQIGEEMRLLAPAIKDTKVVPEVCILYTHDNEWALSLPRQPNKSFSLRDHIQLFYNALHDRNIPVDFAKPNADLSQYKLVIAPSMHLISVAETDFLKLYVQNGGTLVSTFNTGLVDEHFIAPDTAYPHNMTDLFGLEVHEFDALPQGEDNHLSFKGTFPTSHMHPARVWCDIIEAKPECQVLATYAKDFYSGTPALTVHPYGLGKAVYIGTMSHQAFYHDLVTWLRETCTLRPLLKVPDAVEVSMRQKDSSKIHFLLNHQTTPVRIQTYKPMHDYLTGQTSAGSRDLPPHAVLVLDEHLEPRHEPVAEAPAAESAPETPA